MSGAVSRACADCLELAGGRQQRHGIQWQVDYCPVCGARTALTHPREFGSPELVRKAGEEVVAHA